MDDILKIARCIAFMSAMCVFGLPRGLAKTGGNSLFIHADITALCISMAVLIVGMSAGPTFWNNKVKQLACMAMSIAVVCLEIAIHQMVLTTVGDVTWLRSLANGLNIVFMGVACVSIFLLWAGYVFGKAEERVEK